MRFLGKYELLEQLTVGRVETFSAYPIGGGERILVHVFPLPALIKSAPTNRDLLDYMQELSPPALGAVLDAGRYDDGSQAYVVTKFPRDLGALPKWVEAYKSMTKKQDTTAEVPAPELWDMGSGDTQYVPVAEKPVGDFTRAFQGVGAKEPAKPAPATDAFDTTAPGEPAREEPNMAVRRGPSVGPGLLTQQWMAGLGEGARLPRSQALASENSGGPAGTPATARESFGEAPRSAPAAAEGDQAGTPARPGEFTMFFKSPLAAPSHSPEPPGVEEPFTSPPPRPVEGEFTKLFGSAQPAGGGSPLISEPLLEPASEAGGFTQVFGKPSVSEIEPPVAGPPERAPRPETAGSYVVRQSTNLPPVPQAKPSIESVFSSAHTLNSPILGAGNSDGATRLFKPPVQDAPPAPPVAPAAESEYTQIISAKPKPAPPRESLPGQPAPPGGRPLNPQIPMPPPPVPSIEVPNPPRVVPPPMPAVQWPAPSPLSIPNAPTVPPIPSPPPGKKPQRWTAFVPLIVILNLLLLAAVSLVLYFVLKH
jgi:hypothetical protein